MAYNPVNMPAGRETKVDEYAPDGTTLLTETNTTYTLDCGPAGDPTTPARFDSNWWTTTSGAHLLVAELDQSNPIAVCDPQVASVQTLTVDGGSLSNAPAKTVTYSYDTNQSYSGSHDYGNVTVVDTVANDGGAVGGPGNDIVQTSDYTVNDTITMTSTSATGTYIVDTAYQAATRSGSATGTIQALTQDYYDGQTSLTAAPTKGDVTEEDVAASGTGPYTFLVTRDGYDSYGNLVGILKPNGQTGCTVGGTSYSSCATYDTASYTAHVTLVTNALGQSMAWNLGTGQSFGYGQWLQNNTDANNQVTNYQYDALARLTGITDPGDTGLTTQYVYSVWCQATGPSIPCSELDTIQRFDSSTTVTSRTFFDGWGKAAETRTPADSAHDVVAYTTTDARGEVLFTSQPYYVSAYTGGPGGTASSNAYSKPDSTQLGSSAVYDALGRAIQATDPAGATTYTNYSLDSDWQGFWYEAREQSDPNGHHTKVSTDALGREAYLDLYSGTDPNVSWYATYDYHYDFQGNLLWIGNPPTGSVTIDFSYDLAGRQTGILDPDLGSITMQLDADGNVTQQTDARGQTVYLGYDALDRELWRNTTSSPTGAYVTYSYDGTVPSGVSCSGLTPGSNAIGHVTTEQFTSGPSNSFSGSYCFGYDVRGEMLGQVDTLAGTTYQPILSTYNDAGVTTRLTYPTGEYEQSNFSAQERLTSITRSARGTTDYLIPSITYTGNGGPAGKPDSYVVGGTGPCSAANSSLYCVGLTYDNDLRLTHVTFSHPTNSTPITYYDLGVGYDAVGNVTSVSAALPAAGGQSGGQDNQQFCYDEQNRLTWAGDTGTNPCTNQAVTGTTLTAASYTASYSYDVDNRITASTLTGALASDPQGSYTYDSTHFHAVDAIGSSYTAQYDASGNMTCRAPTGSETCTSTSQTGAQFTYDVEGRLIQWVSADGATTVKYGYDGEGNRFEMQVTSGSTTTTTTYLGNLEEVQVVGSSTTTIVYFYWGGQRVAEDDNTHWYYPINDGLTTTTVVVDASGVIAAQLFGPYGQTRWAGGTMPTTFGFTGQRSDVTTGLDYYGARYYDPLSGCFTSADTVLPGGGFDPAGLNRYGYVAGNPETATDPTGHHLCGANMDDWCPDRVPGGGGSGSSCRTDLTCDISTTNGDSSSGSQCGRAGIASCSSGGTDVGSCRGKHHCVIFIDGGPAKGTNGLAYDINAWQKWINDIMAKYGGDVGFILMETDGSDANSGVDLIHTTLQSLALEGYTGNITLIGQSAGAAAVFMYLNAKDQGQYGSDAQIHSLIALDAPQQNPMVLAGVGNDVENHATGWNGDISGAADYVNSHHIKGLYAWDVNDWISGPERAPSAWGQYAVAGGGIGLSEEPGPTNAHTYLEYNGCDVCLNYVS